MQQPSVKDAQQHHRPVERDEQVGIGGEGGERPVYRAVWREVIAVAHLKARDHREILVCHFLAGHALTPGAILPSSFYVVFVPRHCKTRDNGFAVTARGRCCTAGRAFTIVETTPRQWYIEVWHMVRLSW